MSAKALWLLGRGFGAQIVLVVLAGLFWAVAAPTVGAKRLSGGDVVPVRSGEVRHLFGAFALLVVIELVAGAVGALVVWLVSRPVRGGALVASVVFGSLVGGFLAVELGGAVRSFLYPGPGPESVGAAAVRLSASEVDTAAVACALGAAVVLFLAASATPVTGSFMSPGRTQDGELVGDSQLPVGESVHSGRSAARLHAAAGGDEHPPGG